MWQIDDNKIMANIAKQFTDQWIGRTDKRANTQLGLVELFSKAFYVVDRRHEKIKSFLEMVAFAPILGRICPSKQLESWCRNCGS